MIKNWGRISIYVIIQCVPSVWYNTNLIRGRVEAQQVTVAPLLAGLRVAAVHVLCSCALQHGGQEGVWGGVLQVKDAGGPAAPRGLVEAHWPPLCVILKHTRVRSPVIFSSRQRCFRKTRRADYRSYSLITINYLIWFIWRMCSA